MGKSHRIVIVECCNQILVVIREIQVVEVIETVPITWPYNNHALWICFSHGLQQFGEHFLPAFVSQLAARLIHKFKK